MNLRQQPKTIWVSVEEEGTPEAFLNVMDEPEDVNLGDDSERTVYKYELVGSVTVTKEVSEEKAIK